MKQISVVIGIIFTFYSCSDNLNERIEGAWYFFEEDSTYSELIINNGYISYCNEYSLLGPDIKYFTKNDCVLNLNNDTIFKVVEITEGKMEILSNGKEQKYYKNYLYSKKTYFSDKFSSNIKQSIDNWDSNALKKEYFLYEMYRFQIRAMTYKIFHYKKTTHWNKKTRDFFKGHIDLSDIESMEIIPIEIGNDSV